MVVGLRIGPKETFVIARITGRLAYKSVTQLIVDVQGIGYQILAPLSTYYRLPEPPEAVSLHIHTHVREDTLSLFGFLALEEKEVFEALLKVNKVGPRLALNILSGIPTEDLRQAIRQGDAVRLNSVPGVGMKTAERIILELRDKLGSSLPLPSASPVDDRKREDAVSALVNLGYRKGEAEKAVERARLKGGESSLENLIKDSLNLLK